MLAQAEAALQEGDHEAAGLLLRSLLELAPGHEDALICFYRLCRAERNLTAAEAMLGRVVTLNPNHFWAISELTLMLLAKGALAEAERHARNAVRIAPLNPQAHNLMGLVLTEANRPIIGEYHYRLVLELSGRDEPITLANLAWNLKNQGKTEEARTLYLRSMTLRPDVLQTVLGFARLEEADRNFPAALALLDGAERLIPGNPGVQLTRATVLARMQQTEAALSILQGAAAGLGPSELSETGRLLDRMGRYDEAFAAFEAGKERALAAGARRYMADHAANLAARLTGFFTTERLRTLPVAGVRTDMPQPIFIVGFPRSGTTLIEQMLSVHDEISAGDELPFINDIAGMMPRHLASPLAYPEALTELWMGDQRQGLDELRDYYLSRAVAGGVAQPGVRFFTDKMPLNEMHLGLIALLFPRSPIIHLRRHPLDVLLSVYANHLTHGYFCAAEMQSIARHYGLVAELVAHYRQHVTMRYLPVAYEAVVADQEAALRRMLDFIGVGFDSRCLAFEQNRRFARTASYAQVTEKLYDRACFRYRHYLPHLAPVMKGLSPLIESLGYSIDQSEAVPPETGI